MQRKKANRGDQVSHTSQSKEPQSCEDFFKTTIQAQTSKSKARKKVKSDHEQGLYPRPSLSYNELIIEALSHSEDGMCSLQEIYDFIQDSYLFFKNATMVFLFDFRRGKTQYVTIFLFKGYLSVFHVPLQGQEKEGYGNWSMVLVWK
jgi:hypothetical protein